MSIRADLVTWLKTQGFEYVRTGGKHEVWSDGKVTTTVPCSPSCPRTLANMKARVKRLRRG
jgi:predicted RNA binding protein YcfA (HicA-like mRNA interferase family)